MAEKTSAEVIIGGKVYTLSGYESEEYLQRVATYINNKVNEFNSMETLRHFPNDMKATLIQLNIADDYFKARSQAEKLEQEIEQRDKEVYDLKHDLISNQIKAEDDAAAANELKEKNQKLQEEKSRLEAERQRFVEESDKLVAENHRLNEEKNNLSDEMTRLMEENRKLQETNKNNEAEKTELQQKVEEENQWLRGERRQLKEENRELLEGKENLERQIHELRANKAKLEAALEDALLGEVTPKKEN